MLQITELLRAWLSFIFAARHSLFVRKLILIGSGPFEEGYASEIMETRSNRLEETERLEVQALEDVLSDPIGKDKKAAFVKFRRLMSKTDSFSPLTSDSEIIECHHNIFHNVWKEAKVLRPSGELLELGKHIQCPVVAIHGDYDPHPFEGVKKPLSRIVKDFRFILLQNCGHYPWIERNAKDRFYEILEGELS